MPQKQQKARWNKFPRGASTNRNRCMFCINKINRRKLPQFHHLPLEVYSFSINHYYPRDMPNIVTVYDRPCELNFLQVCTTKNSILLSLQIIKTLKNSNTLTSKVYIPDYLLYLELTEKSFITLCLPKVSSGTALVVHWVRLRIPSAGGPIFVN